MRLPFAHVSIALSVQMPPERIEAALRRTGPVSEKVKDVIGTAAQIWVEQGKATGIVEGKADTFLRLARRKFSHQSAERTELVRSASLEQLDAWIDALITAEDIDAVFGERTRH